MPSGSVDACVVHAAGPTSIVMSEERRVVLLLLQVCSLPAKQKKQQHTKAVIGEKLNVDVVVHRMCLERK